MDIAKELEPKLKIAIDGLKNELSGIRTNRPTPKLIEDVEAEYFGSRMPIKQLGSIGVVPPRELQVSPWDKNALPAIQKAIESANLGLSVAVTGNIVRVTLPMLSDERRNELIKVVKNMAEEARRKTRATRDEENKKVDAAEKAKELTEDDKFTIKKKIQELVDKAGKDIEVALEHKIKEIQE